MTRIWPREYKRGQIEVWTEKYTGEDFYVIRSRPRKVGGKKIYFGVSDSAPDEGDWAWEIEIERYEYWMISEESPLWAECSVHKRVFVFESSASWHEMFVLNKEKTIKENAPSSHDDEA